MVAEDLLRSFAGNEAETLTATTPTPLDDRARDCDVEERARKYLRKMEPAISGRGGHDQTFKAACKIGPGFDLPLEVAYRLLWTEYNPRCEPPWSEAELRHKLDDAYANEPRRGWLRDEPLNNGRRNGKHKAAHDGAPPSPETDQQEQGDAPPRPVIMISTEEDLVIDQAAAAVADDPTIYQRGFMLVTVQREKFPKKGDFRPPGSPRITALPPPRLRERMAKYANWRMDKTSKGEGYKGIPAHPPAWAVAGLAARGEWEEIRPLEAVVESPVLRQDGSVLDKPGYDPATALLYEPNAVFPAIKSRPTLDDAKRSAARLTDLVVDFPFKTDVHKAAWLAAALTPLARFAIDGPCPFFLFDSTTAGSGKGLLADILSVISTGREIPRKDYPDCNEELRKTITSIALAGDRLVLFDNITITFGGSALDSALTARTWKDRILGRSEMTADLPLFTVWYGSGNNVELRGDVMRRIVPCRLESEHERPEERTGFTYPRLMQTVHRRRPELVAAVLTLLRAYVVAGRPDQNLTPFGSFEAWSDLIRSAVFWTLGLDPCWTREDLRAADSTSNTLKAVIEGWANLPEQANGLTASEALKIVAEDPARHQDFRETLMSWAPKNAELPNPRMVGNRLKSMRGKVVDGRFMHSDEYKGTQKWSVKAVTSGGSGGSGGSSFSLRACERNDKCRTKNRSSNSVEQSHQSHQSHQEDDEPANVMQMENPPY
jgi:hypothetical protein